METSFCGCGLNDLPNEIMMIIFKYLHHYRVVYSFFNINGRFDAIINKTIIEKQFTLCCNDGSSLSLNDTIFDRFLLQSLPSIHHKIQWLNVKSSSLERILLSADYPNLNALGVYDILPEEAVDMFSDTSVFRRFEHNIPSFIVRIKPYLRQTNLFEDKNTCVTNMLLFFLCLVFVYPGRPLRTP